MPWRKSDVLIVDDQQFFLNVLHDLVTSELPEAHVVAHTCAETALEWARSNTTDLVLVDYRMPRMNGVQFILALRSLSAYNDVPIIMVTEVNQRPVRLEALAAGATDFVTKPVDESEFRARCRNLLTLHHQATALRDRTASLEDAISRATHTILLREEETLRRLARVGEYRDEETGYHLERMARYSRIIAETAGLPENDCEILELAAPMHDLGKVSIPDAILLKPGKLTETETFVMRQHAVAGYEILKGSPSRYLQAGAVIALSHHEKFDGTGYPSGLRGEEIPQFGRIVAIADVFDALTSRRPYKEPWPFDKAVKFVADEVHRHFDPMFVDAFLSRLEKVREIFQRFRDSEVEGPQIRNLR